MPIDPNIAMGYRPPQFESPVNQMAAVTQLQSAQQANELNRQKMEEYARAREMEGVRRNALAGIDLNSPDSFNTVAQRLYNMGDLAGAQDMLKARADLDYKQAQTGKEKATTEKTGVETKLERLKLFRDQLPILAQNPTDEAIRKWATLAVQNGAMDFKLAEAGIDAYLKLPLNERSQKLMQAALTAKDSLEQHYMQVNSGDKTTMYAAPKFGTAAPRVVQEDKINLSPVERGRLGIERERLNRDNSADNVAHVITDDRGNVTMINKKGQVIGPKLEGAGKQSASYAKTTEQQKQLAQDRKIAIAELENITKDGGLIDQSTSSYIGKGVDIAARTVGTATPGDIAAGQLAPIADLVLKMVPRFEGPQSEKDVASYTRAAGQLADTTLPTSIRKAAGKEILRLLKDKASSNPAPSAGDNIDSLLDKYK